MGVRQKYRVVVADDAADVRALLVRVLRRSGRFDIVAQAHDGQTAIAAAEAHQPDLTLLDLRMPGIDGLSALPEIRRVAPHVTVVVLSGLPHDDFGQQVLEQGAAAYLEKGLPPDRLVLELLSVVAPAEEAPSEDEHHARLDLPADLASGRAARRFLEERLKQWGLADLLDEALLLTSELVNNAVVHAHSGAQLIVRASSGRLRVEVADQGVGALELKPARTTDTSGRGLFLVEAMSRNWGTVSDNSRKSVWFEL